MTNKIMLHDRVLIKKDTIEEKTKGGIILANTDNSKVMMGTIINVGPGYYNQVGFVPTTVKPGERTCFSKFAGADVVIDGEEYVIFKENDLFYTEPKSEC